MELSIINRQFELPAEISNLEEIRQWLIPKLEFYKSLVVTEDGIKSAKSDKADLNKLRKAIDDKRKEIKKDYLKPYNDIENECKKIISLIDEPIKAIDEQIKAFDEKEKSDKKISLKTAFFKIPHLDWIEFEKILPEKWANKTEKTENLINEIQNRIEKINAEYTEITEMYTDSPLLTAIQERYRTSGSKAETLAYAVTLERQYQTAQRESVSDTLKTDCNNGNIITHKTNQNAIKSDSGSSQMISGTFRLTCTKSQLIALRDFMKDNGISFEVVK